MVVVAALLASGLVVAPAALRAARAGANPPPQAPQADAPYLCGGSGEVNTIGGQLRVQVPAGASISVAVTAWVSTTPPTAGPDAIAWAQAEFMTADGSRRWSVYQGQNADYPNDAVATAGGSFTNAGSTSLYLWFTVDQSYAILGTLYKVFATVTFTGGSSSGVSCLPLSGNEFDVPNAANRNSCAAHPSDGDPVNVIQGNFWETFTDLAITGRGPGVAWDRTYTSSRASTDGPLGYGWAGSYQVALSRSGDVITITQENGAAVAFTKLFGSWVAPARSDASLVEETDGTFTFTRLGRQVFRFSSAGRLTAIKDLSGNSVTLGYTSGQLTSITDPAGRSLTITWTGSHITKVTGPSTVLSTGGTPVAVEASYTYDGSGNLSTVTDATGGIWTYTYDTAHRVVTIREPRHHSLGAAAPVVENHYDSSGRVDWQEDRLDRRTTFGYATGATTVTDPAGHVAVYEHSGGVCTGLIKDPGANQSRWVYEIDPATLGRTKVTDPNGNVTTATYDSRGRQTSMNDNGRITETTYTPQGLPATVKDPSGITTTYTYDAGTDRLRSVSRPVTPGTGNATTSLSYTDAANPGLVTSTTDTRGKVSTVSYTTSGDPASSTDPTGRKTTWTYNSLGWPLSMVAPAGNAPGGTPSQQTTSYTYNKRGQVMTITDPLGAVTTYGRDLSGNVTTINDPVATGTEQTTFTIDAASQTTGVTRPDGSVLATDYWGDGSVKTQRDAATNATSYSYDAQGRLSTTTDPAGRVTTLRYDLGGRVATKQQPGGSCTAATKTGCITYSYNTGDDLTGVDHSDAGTADLVFGYDSLHRRTTMNDGSSSTWTYDSLGRLLSFADSNGTTAYTFTDNGAGPTTITYPGGKAVSRTYDDAGRLKTTTGWTGGTATYGYDDNANQTTTDTGATTGVEDTYGYDRANRMTAATVRQGTTTLTALAFGRDPEGLIQSTTATGVPGAAGTYGYNGLDQLTSTGAGSFNYDAADNLTGIAGGLKQRFNAAHELCYAAAATTNACGSPPTDAVAYSYDGRGNRTGRTPALGVPSTYRYDQADRLVGATVPSYPDGAGQLHELAAPAWPINSLQIQGGQAQHIQIRGASPVPTSGVQAAVVRLHISGTHSAGGMYSRPYTTAAPTTSDPVAMYFDANEARSNLAITKLDPATGKITVTSSVNATISVELLGWYEDSNTANGLALTTLATPYRITPPAFTAPTGGTSAPIQVTGANGIPSSGVSALAVVVHSAGAPSGPGLMSVYSGSTPGTVSLLFDAGYASALTIVPVDATGTLRVMANKATSPLLDVVGYYTDVKSGDGLVAHAVDQAFIAYTANGSGTCNPSPCQRLTGTTNGTMGPVTNIKVTGSASNSTIPEYNVGAVAVVIQAVLPSGVGRIITWKKGDPMPAATAALGFNTGDQIVSATEIIPVSDDGMISIASSANVDIAIQAVGYYDKASTNVTYTYAGDGLRTQKTTQTGTVATTTKYTWDRSTGIPELLAEAIDEPGTTNDRTVRYVYGPGGTVTSDITAPASGGSETLRWYHHDQLGSTIALTSTTGAPLGTTSYTPYGTIAATTGSAATPMGWAGEYRDSETGFVYLRARYYDPATGQFLTRDPLEALTGSAYGYGGNSPTNMIDPSGLCWGPTCVIEDVAGAVDDAWDASGGKVVTAVNNSTQTVGLCLQGEVGFVIHFAAQACVVVDRHFNVAATGAVGAGGGSPGISAGVGPVFSNADNVHDLNGRFVYGGASGCFGPGVGVCAGGDVATGTNCAGTRINTFSPSIGIGAPALPFWAEMHGGASYTGVLGTGLGSCSAGPDC
jgi:RHS repeat-associated protein